MAEVSGTNSHSSFPVTASRATSLLEGIRPMTLLSIITGLKYTPPPSVVSSNRQTSCNCETLDVSIFVSAENLLLETSRPKVGQVDVASCLSGEQVLRKANVQ